MKVFLLFLSLLMGYTATAQWSNTTNQFYDSLHMPVSTVARNQVAPLVVQSYPDSGYFIIWEDTRNDPANSKLAIYAQKYDKTGTALWTVNGLPVSASSNNQHYTFASNTDYRNRSYAATDSAGGFYITYSDDSVSSYTYERACLQHINSSGTPTLGSKGYILTTSTEGNLTLQPQLIADGNKGCFVSFRTTPRVYLFCYKEATGSLQYYGGGIMNENAVEIYSNSPCGNYTYLQYTSAEVLDYMIFPDLQGGCNIVMSLSANGSQGKMMAYNKLWRAKKNATVAQPYVGTDYNPVPASVAYQKDSVYRLYFLRTDHQEIHCGDLAGNVYVVNQYRLVQNGFQVLDGGSTAYDFSFPKGVTVATTGNINATMLGVTKRSYSTATGVSNASVQGYSIKEEIYDSIPYQRASTTNPGYPGYNTVEPPMNKLNYFRDSIIGQGTSIYDFSLSGGANQIFSAALLSDPGNNTFNLNMRLQHLAVERQSADSFAVVYKTSRKGGELIGNDGNDFRFGTEYDLPLVAVNKNGAGLFYVKESKYAGTRVSPLFNGAQLTWGALGRQIGTGVYNNSPYNIGSSSLALDPIAGKAVIAWYDDRNTSTTGLDVFMRHLDSLNSPDYYPPVKKVRLLSNPYTALSSLRAVMYGVSKHYTLLEAAPYAPYTNDPGITPLVEIKDDNYLGAVTARGFQNTGSIRTYNGKAYLDRNFTIYADSVPPAASFNIRLYFTKTEFNALKATDNSVATPADLVVIKQPHNSSAYPTAYSPVANEQTLPVLAWDSVAGGYYVQVRSNSLGDFFIQKTGIAPLCPGSSGSITSNLTGSSYQWKVNTGSGFVNLSNGGNYSGVTTATLQLNAIPSAWSGYQYLCTVNGTTNSTVTTLRLINTWSGTMNNNWENAANWSCGSVPDANTDVVLNAGTIIVNSNATCRSLTINPGVSFTVKTGYTITVMH